MESCYGAHDESTIAGYWVRAPGTRVFSGHAVGLISEICNAEASVARGDGAILQAVNPTTQCKSTNSCAGNHNPKIREYYLVSGYDGRTVTPYFGTDKINTIVYICPALKAACSARNTFSEPTMPPENNQKPTAILWPEDSCRGCGKLNDVGIKICWWCGGMP